MNSIATTVLLPAVLGVIMLGLGLSLTLDDFRAVRRSPVAIAIALTCQVLLLPAFCFALVAVLALPPALAVGMVLLAASPGGTSASLFSHLFRGDVALNVTTLLINALMAVVTLPLTLNLAVAVFYPAGDGIGAQLGKVVQVVALVIIPIALGGLIRQKAPGFARRMDRPVRILAVIALFLIAVLAVAAERQNLLGYLSAVGLAAAIFCLVSLGIGYFLPRAARVGHRQAIALCMEIGVHNGALAITIAMTVLGSTEMAIPPAIYTLLQPFFAALVGALIVHRFAPIQPAGRADRPRES